VKHPIFMAALFGFLLGWTIRSVLAPDEPPPDQVRYEAYRDCIPRPNCMTADDYIDYYDLKWKLEQE